MTLKYFFKKIKDVHFSDILSFGKLFVALVFKPFVKKRYQHCWVVCETANEARDNGYHFFKHVRECHKDIMCFYAIDKKSPDIKKVKKLGNIVQYGSIKHWVLYLCADYNISSQKGGKPNTAVCAFLELLNLIDSKLVFLQHGVIINDVAWAHANTTQLKYFITSTLPETQYIKKTFGFEENKIILTGMPRFDNLHNNKVDPHYILIMPTWRSRFSLVSERQDVDNDFVSSVYKKSWEGLLNSTELANLIEKNNLKVVFFPHRHMQQFLGQFEVNNDSITIADWRYYDIQDEMKKAALMITDYSSVFFYFVYMKKPVIFYQFDYDEFRKYDYKEGYFDYKNTQFGKWCDTSEKVIDELLRIIASNMKVSDDYLEEHSRIFPYWDNKNSERLVTILRK